MWRDIIDCEQLFDYCWVDETKGGITDVVEEIESTTALAHVHEVDLLKEHNFLVHSIFKRIEVL